MKSQSPLDKLSDYEIRHLASHLLDAAEYRALHGLLNLEDSGHRNAWFEAKSRLGDISGYLADVARAWDAVEQENRRSAQGGLAASSLPLQLGYAFTVAAVASIARQGSGMTLAFVQQGLWRADEALTYARQITDWDSQLQTMTGLAGAIDGEPRRWCETHALELIATGPAGFPSRNSVGLDAGIALQDDRLRAECLAALAMTLPESLLPQAVAAGLRIGNWFWRIHGLRNVCPRVAGEQRRSLVEDLVAKARRLRLRFLRAEALASLAPVVDEQERETTITEALHEAVDVLNDWEARRILASEPRSGIFTIRHDVQRQLQEDVRPLRLIAPHARVDQIREVLAKAEDMDGLPMHEAMLVLIPELAARGAIADAIQAAGRVSHPVYRNLIRAALSPFVPTETRKPMLQQACAELAGLTEPEVRAFCLSTISIHLGNEARATVLRSVIRETRILEIESLRADILTRVAHALEGCRERDRLALARDAFEIANGIRESDRDTVLSVLIPRLGSSEIEREFQNLRRVAFGNSSRRLREAWGAPFSATPSVTPQGRSPLPAEFLLAAFGGASMLRENQRSRLIKLAAPSLGSQNWQLAIDTARAIESSYLRSQALYMLAIHAPEKLRSELALETIDTIWAISGGLSGAAPLLETMAPIAALGFRLALFDSWSRLLRSLSRDSVQTMLQYLEPAGSILRVLGGSESPHQALDSLQVVERWWGKKGEGGGDGPGACRIDVERFTRFSEDAVPLDTPHNVAAITQLFIDEEQFELAERLIVAFQETAGNSSEGMRFIQQRMMNAIFCGVAGAGRLDAAMDMLARMAAPSNEGVDLLVRRLISHGRIDDSYRIFERMSAEHGDEGVLQLAPQLIEHLLAEDRLSEALALFQGLSIPDTPGLWVDAYTDIVFMLTNALLKVGDINSAERMAGRLQAAHATLRSHVAARLARYVGALRDEPRTQFWNRIITSLRSLRGTR